MTKDVFAYFWLLAFVASAVLTLIGILRWLADQKERPHRLSLVSCCAFIVFLFMLLSANWASLSALFNSYLGDSESATKTLISTSKITVKLLLLVLIVAFAVLLTLTASLFVLYGLWAIICTVGSLGHTDKEELEKRLHDKSEKLKIMLNNPVFFLIIDGAILTIFLIIPLMIKDDSTNLAESWKNGVNVIAQFCNTSGNKPLDFTESLPMYLLIYISILGIGYATASILFEIIKKIFDRKKGRGFLSRYSNTIGLMAVAVSVLLLISWGKLRFNSDSTWLNIFINFSKPFALAIFIIVMGVITLEVLRLIMDMRETLIRKEARYVFIMLVGQCTVIIVKAFSLIYNALSGALAGDEMQEENVKDCMGDILEQIPEKIARDINKEISETESPECNMEMPYAAFKKSVTKK